MKIDEVNFKKGNGLIPAVIQDSTSGKVLMVGFMNKKALANTFQTGFVWFWSRTKKRLWQKGETSGNRLVVKNIFIDCDNDSLLVLVDLIGKSVCHTGNKTCFSQILQEDEYGSY